MAIKALLIILLLGASYMAYEIFYPNDKTKGKLTLTQNQKKNYRDLMKEENISPEKIKHIERTLFANNDGHTENEEKKNVVPELQNYNQFIAMKIEKIYISSSNNLTLDIKFGNKTSSTYNNRISVECIAYLDGKPIEKFKWSQLVDIKPKKGIFVKKIDFGKIASPRITEVKCHTL